MTAPSPDITHSLLLQVIEQISGLDHRVGHLQGQNNIIITEQQRAAEGRKETHDRLRKLEQSASGSATTLERIAPLVEAHETTYQRGIGAAWLWRILWGLLAGGSGAGVLWLVGKLTGHA